MHRGMGHEGWGVNELKKLSQGVEMIDMFSCRKSVQMQVVLTTHPQHAYAKKIQYPSMLAICTGGCSIVQKSPARLVLQFHAWSLDSQICRIHNDDKVIIT